MVQFDFPKYSCSDEFTKNLFHKINFDINACQGCYSMEYNIIIEIYRETLFDNPIETHILIFFYISLSAIAG